ncbi:MULTISPECIES: hypothetical protein [unclassified Streptomyces]|uniref:hypothetical protein n=1 Tax=unclassified Streptomyces TaxID=2593676 RepID=UPI001BE793F8|nr:hypothetical protein [Streptomyces sp. McG3]MBT2897524.1 hypothetical protein [Streptomyces sp. McG3]
MDSQPVIGNAVVGAGSCGFDDGKLVNGRKRRLVVDCLGLVLAVLVTPASSREAFVLWSMTMVMSRRLARHGTCRQQQRRNLAPAA